MGLTWHKPVPLAAFVVDAAHRRLFLLQMVAQPADRLLHAPLGGAGGQLPHFHKQLLRGDDAAGVVAQIEQQVPFDARQMRIVVDRSELGSSRRRARRDRVARLVT